MSDDTSKRGKKQVLSDHKRVGKRFIPPLLQVAPFHDLSWVDCTLPELLWLGLLNNRYGLKRGSDLGLSLAKAAAEASVHSIGRWYAPTSAYSSLTDRAAEKRNPGFSQANWRLGPTQVGSYFIGGSVS